MNPGTGSKSQYSNRYQAGSDKYGRNSESKYGNNSTDSEDKKGRAMHEERPGSWGARNSKAINERPKSAGTNGSKSN